MTEKCWYILTDYGKIVYQDKCLSNLYATEDIYPGHEELTINPIRILQE